MTYSEDNKVDGIVLVTEDSQAYLNPRQEVAYREHRRELAEWMLGLGRALVPSHSLLPQLLFQSTPYPVIWRS
jgi:hypothetical protein